MGMLEERAKKRRRKDNLQGAVLGAIALSGMLAWAAMAPNTLQLLRYVPDEKLPPKFRLKRAADHLVRKRLAAWTKEDGKTYLRITDKGRQEFEYEQAKIALATRRSKRWDGQWRVVAFDLPERRRGVRVRLRTTMREIGFVRLQDSVWVYPYDCEDFIALLKLRLKAGGGVLYLIADQIENDKALRAHFGLPPPAL